MTRTHRRLHKIFWLVATPVLIVIVLLYKPSASNELMPIQDIPDGSSIAVFETKPDSNKDSDK